MAGRSAGVITINLNAGTTQFIVDMEKANASVKRFGAGARGEGASGMRALGEAAHGSASGVQAISGALRVLEGGVTNNLRAAERFIANVLGLGPILQAAFPVIGAIAFLGVIGKVGGEVYKFYRLMQDAPEKMRGTFSELNAGLRKTNDELDLTNARLENDIAKLEGKRQNTLKVALDEARISADSLAESLDKALSSLNKVLEENKSNIWQQIFGRISDKGLRTELGGETGFGGFRADVRGTTESGRANIEAAAKRNDQAGVDAAIKDLKERLAKKYQDMLGVLDQQIATATVSPYIYDPTKSQAANQSSKTAFQNAQPFLEELRFTRANIAEEARTAPEQIQNYQLNKTKTALDAGRDNAKLDRPLDNKLKELDEQIAAAKLKLNAAGLGEAEKVIAKAEGEALKAIEEVNKALGRQGIANAKISPQAEADIRTRTSRLAATEAEEQWRTKLAQTTATIRDQVQSQEMLTAAIGKGYEAVKQASVETQVMARVGAEQYNDPKFRADNQADIAAIRAQEAAAYEAKHREQITATMDSLRDQITLEQRLAQVQSQGAAAVRLATLQYNLAQIQQKENSKELVDLERDLFAAREANNSAAQIAKINDEIAAVKRLAAAQIQGADAVRNATNQNKYQEIRKQGGTQIPGMLGMTQEESAAIAKDEAEHQLEIAKAASETVNIFQDRLSKLADEKAFILANLGTYRDTADVARALRDIEDQRLKIAVEQQLAQGTAMAGVRAFFLEMQEQAKTTAAIMYEALNNAVNNVSDNLTRALTGQKTQWGKMFQDIGRNMLKETIKSDLQTGIVKLGGKVFPGLGKGAGAKLGSSPTNPIWARLVDGGSGGSGSAGANNGGSPGILNGNGGLLGTGQVPKYGAQGTGDDGTGVPPPPPKAPPAWLKLLGIGLGAPGNAKSGGDGGSSGGGGGGEDVNSSISYPGMASGGDITPGQVYQVGERGPELFRSGVGGRIINNADSRRMMANGGSNHFYTIDARGTDPVLTAQRTEAAIRAAHDNAIGMSVRANHDRVRRVPSGR